MAIVSPLVGQPWDDIQYRRAHGASAEGIIRDESGASFRLTTDVANSSVVLAAGEACIQGYNFYETGTTTIKFSDYGSVPQPGQSRVDRIVLQYDPSATGAPVKIVLKPGVPAGNAAAGAVRQRAGLWEIPMYTVSYIRSSAGSVSFTVVDERIWTGPSFVMRDGLTQTGSAFPASSTFPGPYYLGTTITQGEQTWRRVLKANVATWQPSLQLYPTRYTGTASGPWSTPVSDNYFRQLGRMTIPDPGYAYFIRCDAQTVAYMNPGQTDGRVDVGLLIGGSDSGVGSSAAPGLGGGELLSSTDGRFGGDLHKLNGMSARTYTGSQTLYLRGFKPYGTGAWVSSQTSFIMTAEITRAY